MVISKSPLSIRQNSLNERRRIGTKLAHQPIVIRLLHPDRIKPVLGQAQQFGAGIRASCRHIGTVADRRTRIAQRLVGACDKEPLADPLRAEKGHFTRTFLWLPGKAALPMMRRLGWSAP
jgi:hypothetical protein